MTTTSSDQPKIFCIGLNKTGTTSLNYAAQALGLRPAPYSHPYIIQVLSSKIGSDERDGLIREVVDQYDLFEDWPWPMVYRRLDRLYPGSKFILTTRRSPEVWYDSLLRHSMITHPIHHPRSRVYGHYFPLKFRDDHVEFYKQHNERVRRYFADRPGDLCEICWETGDGWKELCDFLDKPLPDQARGSDGFIHANSHNHVPLNRTRRVINSVLQYVMP